MYFSEHLKEIMLFEKNLGQKQPFYKVVKTCSYDTYSCVCIYSGV